MKELEGIGLLLVDIQNDFIDGTLKVEDAISIMPTVKKLIEDFPFQLIICSQDYHPEGHISFAAQHSMEPFQIKKLAHPIPSKAAAGETIDQMMWPDHCVQGTRGCEIHKDVLESLEKMKLKASFEIVRKGEDKEVDGYSAFSSNHYLKFSRLPQVLFSQQPPIHTLVVVGVATDYCVMSSAIDSIKFNLRTIVIQDGIRGAAKDTTSNAIKEMTDWGIEVVQSESDLRNLLEI